MSSLKRVTTMVLILSIFSLNFPAEVFAKKEILLANTGITEHQPMILATPEINIPVGKVQKKKISKWVWIGLGVLAVGAAAGGGGGGGGSDAPPPAGADTGDVTVTW